MKIGAVDYFELNKLNNLTNSNLGFLTPVNPSMLLKNCCIFQYPNPSTFKQHRKSLTQCIATLEKHTNTTQCMLVTGPSGTSVSTCFACWVWPRSSYQRTLLSPGLATRYSTLLSPLRSAICGKQQVSSSEAVAREAVPGRAD